MPKPVILCVDDEAVILDSLKKQLKNAFDEAYYYELAESADEALEIIEEFQSAHTNIIVIVSDWLMPGTKDDEFLIEVHKRFPKIIKIMLTGQADEKAIQIAKKQANLHACLYKPWDGKKLVETIKAGLVKQ
jgi:CheY-like chemotaxis protein